MSKLVLHDTQVGDREFALDRERISIGRKEQNDIHLPASAVSAHHAVIITLGGDSFLEDLHSTNGTYVNQNIVHKCVLQDGDEIKIANYKLTFISDPTARSALGMTISSTPKSELAHHGEYPTMAMDAITLMPELTELVSSVMPDETPQNTNSAIACKIEAGDGTLGVIRILSGPGSGQRLALTKPVTTLGKPGTQVVAITLRDGLYYLGIVEGEELPRINGSEIKELPYPLQQRDIIDIAGVQLEFTLK